MRACVPALAGTAHACRCADARPSSERRSPPSPQCRGGAHSSGWRSGPPARGGGRQALKSAAGSGASSRDAVCKPTHPARTPHASSSLSSSSLSAAAWMLGEGALAGATGGGAQGAASVAARAAVLAACAGTSPPLTPWGAGNACNRGAMRGWGGRGGGPPAVQPPPFRAWPSRGGRPPGRRSDAQRGGGRRGGPAAGAPRPPLRERCCFPLGHTPRGSPCCPGAAVDSAAWVGGRERATNRVGMVGEG